MCVCVCVYIIYVCIYDHQIVHHNPCWMLDVSWTASYEITLVRLSVCPSVCSSVRSSLSFLKIGSLAFSDI